MRRHRFDPISFSFGLAFLAVTALLTAGSIDLATPGLRWIGAGFLLLLGILLVITSATRSDDHRS
jgi:hypothetical protein